MRYNSTGSRITISGDAMSILARRCLYHPSKPPVRIFQIARFFDAAIGERAVYPARISVPRYSRFSSGVSSSTQAVPFIDELDRIGVQLVKVIGVSSEYARPVKASTTRRRF